MLSAGRLFPDLRARALQLRPTSDDPDKILVGLYVVTPGVVPHIPGLQQADFRWFRANETTKASTLRKQADTIIKPQAGGINGSWDLQSGGMSVLDTTLVSSFDPLHERFVFFTAVLPDPANPNIRTEAPIVKQEAREPQREAVQPSDSPPVGFSSGVFIPAERGVMPGGFKNPVIRYPIGPAGLRGTAETLKTSMSPVKNGLQAQISVPSFAVDVRSQSPAPTINNPLPPPSGSHSFTHYRDSRGVTHQLSGIEPVYQPHAPHQLPPFGGNTSAPRPSPISSRDVVKTEVAGIIRNDVKREESEELAFSRMQLQELFQDVPIETMERGIKAGLSLIENLKQAFSKAEGKDSEPWLAQIEKISKQAQYQKTVIGVVGNTGAGKSSIINALLDEERLVPTNCMRACTAVVTEISYNAETNHPYRAKVEFITAADWERELKALYQDLLDAYGDMKNTSRDNDASVAWAKLHAVYPRKTKEMIANASVEDLLRDSSVRHILGETKVIEQDDPLKFYKQLQKYVDSQEKARKDDKSPKEMEYWPLIRVVKIFVKSPTLQTGAVVVDLPGVHDANAARAAVADSYMQKCTGLWIVAPITRAVDDKAAHKLMGDGFRRQLLMDGGFSSISFICSKSDDISVSEAMLSLGLEDELEPLMREIDNLDNKRDVKKGMLKEQQETRSDINDAAEDLEEELSVWEELKDQMEEGKTVYKPKENKKRKRVGDSRNKAKKAKRSSNIDDFIVDSESEVESDEEPHQVEEDKGPPLTDYEIEEKIAELKVAKKQSRKAKQDVLKSLNELKGEIAGLSESIKEFENKVAARCIAERNKYSTSAIQQDFAAGLQELDREAAEEGDGENYDPNTDLRDYGAVANSLPVFCVSSRGYQKLQGRLKKDGDPPVFQKIDQTGMPSLQVHCTKLTEKGRLANGRKFLTSLSQLCNSLMLWASNASANLTQADRDREVFRLNGKFEGLDKGLDSAIENTISELKEELKHELFDRFVDAVTPASSAAVATVDKWGSRVDRVNPSAGGYYWSTYKALCRRDGVFSNGNGAHDWNMQLAEPMIRIIAAPWEKVFSRRIPALVKKYATQTREKITCFHKAVADQAGPSRAAHLHLLSGQLNTYGDSLQSTVNDVVNVINTAQREINREFTPVIMAVMHDSYSWCAAERGPGQFMRMKGYMHNHAESHKTDMFEQSTSTVKARLVQLVKVVEDEMEETTMRLYADMQKDYHSIFSGEAQDFSGGTGRKEREVKNTLKNALKNFEKPFLLVVGQDVKVDPETDTETEIEHQIKVENRKDLGEDIGHVNGEAKVDEGKLAEPNIKQENQDDAAALAKEVRVKDGIMDI